MRARVNERDDLPTRMCGVCRGTGFVWTLPLTARQIWALIERCPDSPVTPVRAACGVCRGEGWVFVTRVEEGS